MPQVLLFLGAGASRPFGVPTMKEFVDHLNSWLSKKQSVAFTHFQEIRDRLRALYGEDVDLEKILDVAHELSLGKKSLDVFKALAPDAALRSQELIERLPSVVATLNEIDFRVATGRESAATLVGEATDCVDRACASADFDESTKAYYLFLRQITDLGGIKDAEGHMLPSEAVTSAHGEGFRAISVATTNYDLSFEAFCSKVNLGWDTGFQPLAADKELTFQGAPQWRGSVVPILKLHGSIDWWRTETNRVINRDSGQIGQRLKDGSKLTRMEIRYPVGSKDLFGDPYLKLYSRFAEYLSESSIWIFIGYSFADPSIRQLVREAIRPRTKMYVIHPHPKYLEGDRLSGMPSGRIYYVPERFPTSAAIQSVRNTLSQ